MPHSAALKEPTADAARVPTRETPVSPAAVPPAEAQPSSSLAAALERVGDRWSLLLVEALLDGARRFNELLEGLPGIAPNILADRLRRLEREGIVVGRPYSRRPPRMEYGLSADGSDLAGALRLLADWGARRPGHGADTHEPLRHERCGTPLEARWYCPTCGETVADREAADTRLI
jgi:DNA-binding HxlR family transcriptional regulator